MCMQVRPCAELGVCNIKSLRGSVFCGIFCMYVPGSVCERVRMCARVFVCPLLITTLETVSLFRG